MDLEFLFHNNIQTTQPMELVCIDFVSIETSGGNYENVLVVTDHFTKYCNYSNISDAKK